MNKLLVAAAGLVAVVFFIFLVFQVITLTEKVKFLSSQTNYLQNYIEPLDYDSPEITVLVKTGRGLYYQKFENYNQVLSFITGLKSTGEFLENTTDSK